MQVTETLSEGLKRGYHRRGARRRHRKPPHRAADRARQDAAAAGLPPGQGAAAGRAPALRHRGHRRGAGGVGQRGHPAGAERARPAAGAAARRSTWSAPMPAPEPPRTWNSRSSWSCCRTSRCRISAPIELTRLKAEVAPETVDKALADIAARNRELVEITPDGDWATAGAAKGDVLTVDYIGRIDGAAVPRRHAATTSTSRSAAAGFIPGFSRAARGHAAGREPHHRRDLPGRSTARRTWPARPRSSRSPPRSCSRRWCRRSTMRWRRSWASTISTSCARVMAPSGSSANTTRCPALRLKRATARCAGRTLVNFAAPRGHGRPASSTRSGSGWRPSARKGGWTRTTRTRTRTTLRAEYRAIAERRVRLGLLLAEIGRVNSITVAPDEMTRAMRAEAARYPGPGSRR